MLGDQQEFNFLIDLLPTNRTLYSVIPASAQPGRLSKVWAGSHDRDAGKKWKYLKNNQGVCCIENIAYTLWTCYLKHCLLSKAVSFAAAGRKQTHTRGLHRRYKARLKDYLGQDYPGCLLMMWQSRVSQMREQQFGNSSEIPMNSRVP